MGVGVALICAPALGYVTTQQIHDSRAASGPLPAEDRARVERVARRGPVPEDDALRQAALRVAEDRLVVLRQTRARALALPSRRRQSSAMVTCGGSGSSPVCRYKLAFGSP
ncbi:MAG: hypothetical protein JWQ26_595 [Modestobacter sp.]|nr:hypothetical protein [Modestobacter sp.]